jgi:hypothetical protein
VGPNFDTRYVVGRRHRVGGIAALLVGPHAIRLHRADSRTRQK